MKIKDESPLWTQENPSICRFCAYAKRFSATADIYCEKKKDFFSEGNTCRKFKYDILKKELRRGRRVASSHSPEDFKI